MSAAFLISSGVAPPSMEGRGTFFRGWVRAFDGVGIWKEVVVDRRIKGKRSFMVLCCRMLMIAATVRRIGFRLRYERRDGEFSFLLVDAC